MTKAAVATVTDRFLNKFNALAEKNGGYLVTNGVTWADIVVAYQIDYIQQLFGAQLVSDDLTALKQFLDNVFNSKGIKEWIAKRPQTPF